MVNIFVSETISNALERRDPVLSNAPKIVKIGWEPQIYDSNV